jgi:enhancing lycopene biosynthesis protein 2
MPKVAVVLSGCGVFDGTEIHEAVSVLLHLSRAGVAYDLFAPDVAQMHVVNHLTHEPTNEQRNVLVESARIARGKIAPLAKLDAKAYDAVLFPGGFGAAKNLCDFATAGHSCHVNPEVERVMKAFHAAKKPIGMCCIAPVIAAKVFGTAAGGPGCSVTIGNDGGTAGAIEKMGSKNVAKAVNQALVDESNKLVTAPAYMYDAAIHEVYDGIGEMVKGVLGLIR